MCDKEWQGVIRYNKKVGAWELVLKLPNEDGLVSNLGDMVW